MFQLDYEIVNIETASIEVCHSRFFLQLRKIVLPAKVYVCV